ncbi:FecR domain-containing protein [Bordetella flabilis]|uniref:Histidine kinase n=1 Tax=Bordetella flabilis TaxID=463014 RepID=A0A193GIV4_9BORD|nr:FecR family protein [Bordetella flabilis]ANN79518.1 histidine kinase [Bordetella flabilis]
MSASPWYRATPDAASISPDAAERALEWLLELQDDAVSPERVAEWARWRDAHPDHERAWGRIESVRGQLQSLSSPANSAIARAALLAPRSEHRRRALKTAAILLFGGGTAWSIATSTPWRTWSSDYRTAIGERRKLVLPDGSHLLLNTDSAIDVCFDDTERRVELISGEILVATAPDHQGLSRPFLVETGDGTARALGTEYSVRRQRDDTEVNVLRGAVRIQPRHNAAQARDVQAGYRASYTARAVTASSALENAAIAWKDGFIVARSMRLDDFLAELGRYSPEPLSCDPAIAGLRLSGSFPVGDIGKVLAALSTTLDIRIEIHSRLWRHKALRLVPAPHTASS